MVDISRKLYELAMYYRSRRGVGHTTVLLEGAKNVPRVILLAHNMRYATELARQCENAEPCSWAGLDSCSFRGKNAPLAIDNSAMIHIFEDTGRVIDSLRQQNAGAELCLAKAPAMLRKVAELHQQNRVLSRQLAQRSSLRAHVKLVLSQVYARVRDRWRRR